MELIDNISRLLGDDLKQTLRTGAEPIRNFVGEAYHED